MQDRAAHTPGVFFYLKPFETCNFLCVVMAVAANDTVVNMVATANNTQSVLPLPDFDINFLNTQWQLNRRDSPKLNTALYSMRCTLSSMCVMHLHTTPTKKVSEAEATCAKTYFDLTRSVSIKYPDAVVCKYVEWVSTNCLTRMTGAKIMKMGQRVRTCLVNEILPLWNSCLDSDGNPPSGKDWIWVCKCVLIMLHRKSKKSTEALAPNAGQTIHV